MFVSDVVAANVIVLNDKIGAGEIYNLGLGKGNYGYGGISNRKKCAVIPCRTYL